MSQVTDGYMREMLQTTKPYTIVLLRKTDRMSEPGTDRIVWEHGRRNFQLRREGKLCVVCPIRDDSNMSGLGIFSTSAEETVRIMDDDPGVKAGIFTYETHSTRSFPGDSLSK